MTTKNDNISDNSIGCLTGIAYRAVNRTLSNNLRIAGNKITSEQYGILKQLWSTQGLTQLDIAKATHKDKPGITRLLNNLEQKGLIERRVNKDDKRCNKIYLTKAGKDLEKTSIELGLKTRKQALEGVNKKELEICNKVLWEISRNLEE
jgi:DNA-binding MarR family transcriptional regulator